MESVIEDVGETVLGGVLQETVDEVTERSKRTWAVVLLALVLGAVVAAVVIRSRKPRAAEIAEGAADTDSDIAAPEMEEAG